MAHDNLDLSALIGSRVCHDLISPIGAIGNGLELLLMEMPHTPELTLIAQSVQNATARVKFFRVAFGKVAMDQHVAIKEAQKILSDLSDGGRVRYTLTSDVAPQRAALRAAFLAALCVETALPLGGTVAITQRQNSWTVQGTGKRLDLTNPHWDRLEQATAATDLRPEEVQFLLLPGSLRDQGRTAKVSRSETHLCIAF